MFSFSGSAKFQVAIRTTSTTNGEDRTYTVTVPFKKSLVLNLVSNYFSRFKDTSHEEISGFISQPICQPLLHWIQLLSIKVMKLRNSEIWLLWWHYVWVLWRTHTQWNIARNSSIMAHNIQSTRSPVRWSFVLEFFSAATFLANVPAKLDSATRDLTSHRGV